MTKKILFGIWMAVFILAGIFGVSSARSRSDSFRGDAASFACNVRSQIAGETVGEDENLTMPEAVSGTVSAYLKTTIRTVKPGGIALAGAGQEEKQPAPLVCCTFLHCLKAYAVWSAVCVSVYLYDICQFFSGLYGCPLPWGRKETVRLHLLVTIT